MSEEMMNHWGGFSPYESFMVSEKVNRRSSGNAVAGLVLGSVGTADTMAATGTKCPSAATLWAVIVRMVGAGKLAPSLKLVNYDCI